MDSNMETEDLMNLPPFSSSASGSENNDLHCEPSIADSLPSNSKVKEDMPNGEIPENNEDDVSQPLLATDNDKDLADSTLQVSVELTEVILVKEKINSTVHTENGSLTVQDGSSLGNHRRHGSPLGDHQRDGSLISSHEIDGSSISGVKRPRMTIDEQQSSVHVVYNSLTRDSKRKLEELLRQWSEWHALHYSSSHDSNEVLESGEETYFPALHVGLDKPSAVSFWMDNKTRNLQSDEFIPLDNNTVPLYDRGYSWGLTSTDGSSNLEGGMEIVDASRCFNCGSYNHSLKECPKPRDNVAVNNARKQLKSRRNQNSSSRKPTRYYQNTPGGKYDGLRPGVLHSETRKLLGLGELDPPPWLNRMREIGYPPGYLDPEDEDQPSGITIFTDEGSKEETEDGEILDKDDPDPPKKKSVEIPGINAPIPENADGRRWTAEPSSFDLSRNQSYRRYNQLTEPSRKGHYHEQRWSRDDEPPGYYSPRYGSYDSSYISYSPRGDISIPISSSFARSQSERSGRRSPLVHERSSNHGSYSSLPASPPNRLLSPYDFGSASSENRIDDRWNGESFTNADSSFHYKDTHDAHHHRRRR